MKSEQEEQSINYLASEDISTKLLGNNINNLGFEVEIEESISTYTIHYKKMNIKILVDEYGDISKLFYKIITYHDLTILFGLNGDANDIEGLRRKLSNEEVEDIDGVNFNYLDFINNLRYCLRFKKDGSLRYVIVEKYTDKSFLYSVFPINGVLLGETSIKLFEKKYNVENDGDLLRCNIGGIWFSAPVDSPLVDTMTIEYGVEMPNELFNYGFKWDLSVLR